MFSWTRVGSWAGIGSLLGWLACPSVAVLAVIGAAGPAQAATTDFVSTWDTRNTSLGSSAANQVRLPLESTGSYNFAVDWESDGTVDQTITSWDQATHTYLVPGVYRITISFPSKISELRGWRFNYGGDRLKIIYISQWGGKVNLGNNGNYFYGAENLRSNAADGPDLSGTTNWSGMFAYATSFNGDIGDWDTSSVTSMSSMFYGASSFNQPIGGWDTGNVTTMSSMFSHATAFNQPIGDWDTANVMNMRYMFFGAADFNQPIGGWDTSNVTNMSSMFAWATSFNELLANWDTGSVTSMSGMFNGATAFNQEIGRWDTSNVTDMSEMFRGATAFNQSIGGWNTTNVAAMGAMFSAASSFNQLIGDWNTGNVTDMGLMFDGAIAFNQDISGWNTSKVTAMAYMFDGAVKFNQPIGDWDTTHVTYMNSMFRDAFAFDQDISGWIVGDVTTMASMFDYSGLSTANYDELLLTWSAAPSLQGGVPLGAQAIQYSCAAKSARQSLIDEHGWVITDAGAGACVSATPNPVTFAPTVVGQTSSATVTVSNAGGANLVLPAGATSLNGADAGHFAITEDVCSGKSLTPLGTCTVTVRFSPTSSGSKSASLRVLSNAASSPDTVSLSGTGIGAPQPPTAVSAVAGDGQISVSWTSPGDDGGSPVLDYTATANPGGATCTASGTSCVVSGLTNGTAYTFTVTARNAIGVSAPSAPSSAVTPQPLTPPPAQPPAKVTGVKAKVGKGKVKVTWKAVAGATSYRVRISKPGGKTYKAWKTTTRLVVRAKVRKGKKYRFQVVAVGPGGRGPVTTIRFKGK